MYQTLNVPPLSPHQPSHSSSPATCSILSPPLASNGSRVRMLESSMTNKCLKTLFVCYLILVSCLKLQPGHGAPARHPAGQCAAGAQAGSGHCQQKLSGISHVV